MGRLAIPDTFMARKKGDVITKAELTALVGYGPSHAKYSLLVAKVADGMMSLKRQAGDPCVVAQVKFELKILTDVEASAYNRHTSDVGTRALRRAHRRQCEVKTDSFTDRQREAHDRHLVVTGARVALTSGSMVNRIVRMKPHERVIPAGVRAQKI